MSSILEDRYLDDGQAPNFIVTNYVGDIETAAGAAIVSALPITKLSTGRFRVTNPGTETGHVVLRFREVATGSILKVPADYVLRNDGTAHYPTDAQMLADIAAVKTDTTTLLARITSTLFTGITSLAQWLGLIAGKQVGNATARTELRATGAGAGTYDETTDSLEKLQADVAALWTTALTESYAADGAAGTPAQILYLIQQAITEFSINSTTKTIKKLDGLTTAATETLDDASSPTSITRAT